MRNSSLSSHGSSVKCCAVCSGKFGLIRHYWWRTALCSQKCVGRFKARWEADHQWVRFARGLVRATEHQAEFDGKCMENRA